MRGGRSYSGRGFGRGNGQYRSSNHPVNTNFDEGSRYKGTYNSRVDHSRFQSQYASNSTSGHYDSRNREKFNSSVGNNRHDSFLDKPYRDSRDAARDRFVDRKHLRQDGYRRTNSSRGGRVNRSPPPPPPPITSAPTSHYRVSTNNNTQSRNYYNNNRSSSSATMRAAAPRKLSARYENANTRLGNRVTRLRQRETEGGGTANVRCKILRNTRISRDAPELRIMRRKLLLAQHKDRAHVARISRLSSNLRRSRLKQISKSPRHVVRRHNSQEKYNSSPHNRSKSPQERHSEEKHHKTIDTKDTVTKSTSPRSSHGKSSENEPSRTTAPCKTEDEKDASVVISNIETDSSTTLTKNDKTSSDTAETSAAADHDESGKNIVDTIRQKPCSGEAAVNAADIATSNNINTSTDGANDEANIKNVEHSLPQKKIDKVPRRFIKLTCINCHLKCTTFKQYSEHLYSYQHKAALRQVGLRQRTYLLRLRARQRAAQREIEENCKEDYEPQFCYLCRLNYRQQKAKHQLSAHHKAMRKFLLPYCSLCRIAFKSPLSYEVHRCSLEHIRCKANSGIVDTESETEMDTNDIDLNQFLTVDSVGEIDVDAMDDDNGGLSENSQGAPQYVKRIDAYYCELCNKFSKANIDMDVFTKEHCAEDLHQHLALEHERKLLNKNQEEVLAEALKINDEAEAENKKKGETTDAEESLSPMAVEPNLDEAKEVEVTSCTNYKKAEKPNSSEVVNAEPRTTEDKVDFTNEKKENNEDDDSEEKLWADVDKDLGDLLAVMSGEVQDNDDDDDDEEDESVLNIDIESEKPKLKEKEVNDKKDEPSFEQNKNDGPPTALDVKVGDTKSSKVPSSMEITAQPRQIKRSQIISKIK